MTDILVMKNGKLFKLRNKHLILENLMSQASSNNYMIVRTQDIVGDDIKRFYIGTHKSNIVSLQLYRQIENFKVFDSNIFKCKQVKHFTKQNKNLLEVQFKY